MADPNEIEDKDQVTPESKDALQEEREREEKKRIKDHEEDLINKSAKGEVVISNPFVEGWIRGFNKIKEFFNTLFNPDDKGYIAENQGSGHYAHEFQEGNIAKSIDPGMMSEEQLQQMVREATEELKKRNIGNDFEQSLRVDNPPILSLQTIAKNSFYDERAWESLVNILKSKEAAEEYRQQFRDKNTNEPQKSKNDDQVK